MCTFVPSGRRAEHVGAPAPARRVSTCGLDGTLRRRRATAASTSRAPCASRARARAPPSATSTSATARAAARRVPRPSARRSTAIRRRTSARRPARPTPTAPAASCASNGSCGPKPSGAVCAQGRASASRGSAPTGSAATSPARAPCVSCNQQGREGTCWPIDVGRPDPHDRLRGPGAQRPAAPRARATASAAARASRPRPSASTPSCSGDRLNTAGTCNGLGSCLPPGMQNCAPYRCADDACINRCASDNDCVAGHAVPERQLRQEAERPAVHGRRRLREQLLRRRRLLRPGLHRRLPQLRAAVVAGRLPAGGRRAATTRATCARPRPRRPAAPTESATARAAAAGTGPAPSAPPSTARTTSTRPSRPAARPAPASRPTRISCVPVRLQRRASASAAAPSTRTARPATSASATRAARSRTARSARPAPSACRATARRASAARPPARARAGRARCRARWAPCTNVPANSPDPAQICVDRTGDLRHQRQVRGRRLPAATRRATPCAAASCPAERHHADARVDLRRRRRVRHAARELLLPVHAAASRACKSTCAADADCAPPERLQQRLVRPAAARRASCAGPGDCQSGFCAQGVCCTTACNGQLHVVRAGRHASAPASRSPPATRIRRASAPPQGADELRQDRLLRRRRRLPAVRGGHPVRAALLPDRRRRRRRWRAPATAPAPAARRRRSRAAPTRATARPATRPAAATATARPANVCNAGACGTEAPRPAVRAAPANATAATASTASAARPASCGNCQSCNVAGMAGTCNPVPADEMEPHGGCAAEPALRVQRQVRRQRRLPERPRHHQLRHRLVQRVDVHAGRQLQRRGRLRAAADELRALRLRRDLLPHDLRRRRRLRRRLHLHVGRLHQPEGQRRRLRRRDRVLQRQLHRRLLLRGRAAAPAATRARSPASRGPASPCPPGPDPAGDCLAMAGVDLRDHRHLRRGRAVRDLPGGHHLRPIDLRGGDADGLDLQRRRPVRTPQ